MEKKQRIDCGNSLENNDSNKNHILSSTFRNLSSYHVAICGQIPSETIETELYGWMGKFGALCGMYLESQNGTESRQAIVLYATEEGLTKAILNVGKVLFKSTILIIEKITDELRETVEKRFILYDNDEEDDIKQGNCMLQDSIIQKIELFLIELIFSRNKIKKQDGRIPIISECDLLMSKLSCDILKHLIKLFPHVTRGEDNVIIPILLLNLIQLLPLHLINHTHTQTLYNLILNGNGLDTDKIAENEPIQILSPLLEHSNKEIKGDVIAIIRYILHRYKKFKQQKSPHPFYSLVKKLGIIQLIYNTCIINGETELIKGNGSYALAKLLRLQTIELNMKKKIIQQIKRDLKEINNPQTRDELLEVLCELSENDENIEEIASDNFVQFVAQLTQTSDESQCDIKENALKLLLILSEKGGTLDQEIRGAVGDFGFLPIFESSDVDLKMRAVTQMLKWNKNEQLLTIQKLTQLRSDYIISKDYRDQFFDEEKFAQIISQAFALNKEIEELEKKNQQISPQTMGIINCIFDYVRRLLPYSESDTTLIINSDLQKLLVNIVRYIPLPFFNNILLESFYCLSGYNSCILGYKYFKLDAHLILTRLFDLPQVGLIGNCLITIKNAIASGSSLFSDDISSYYFHLISPKSQKNPLFIQLQNNGMIDKLEQCFIKHESREEISELMCEILSLIYKGRFMPPSILKMIINYLLKFIKGQLKCIIDFSGYMDPLKYISLYQGNHDIILNSGILQYALSDFDIYDLDDQYLNVELLLILYQQGNTNMRQSIKSLVSDELIQGLIQRKYSMYQFMKVQYNRQDKLFDKAVRHCNDNNTAFAFILWLNNEEQMDQISLIQNEISLEIEKSMNESCNNNMILNDNIIWKKVEQMISIVKEINDRELIGGAMLLVNEGIYSILFEIAKRMNETEVDESLNELQKVVNNVDDNLLFNLVSKEFCLWVQFIIEGCLQNNLSLDIKAKIISLVTSISLRGVSMATKFDTNHFLYQFTNTGLDQSLQKIIKFKYNQDEIKEKDKEKQENIKLQAIIGYLCFENTYSSVYYIFNECTQFFKIKLQQFYDMIMKHCQSDYSLPSQSQYIQLAHVISTYNKNEIDSYEIETVCNVLLAISLRSQLSFHGSFDFYKDKTQDLIIPYICQDNYSLLNSPLISKLISNSFIALQELITLFQNKEFDEFILKTNIIKHINSIIISCTEQIKQCHSGTHSLLQLRNSFDKEFIQTNLIANMMQFLGVLMQRFRQFAILILSYPELIERIIDISLFKDKQTINDLQFSKAQFQCLQIVLYANELSPVETICQMISKTKERQLLARFMFNAGNGINIYDYLTSEVIQIVCQIFNKIQNESTKSDNRKIIDDFYEEMIQEGLEEENDILLFHSNKRVEIYIQKRAKKLQLTINKYQLQQPFNMEDNESDSDSDNSDSDNSDGDNSTDSNDDNNTENSTDENENTSNENIEEDE